MKNIMKQHTAVLLVLTLCGRTGSSAGTSTDAETATEGAGESELITSGTPSPACCQPLTGVLKTAVIIVRTTDTPSSSSVGVDAVRKAFFDADTGVRAFYQETSEGQFDVQGEVFGPVTIAQRDICLSRPPDLEKLRVWYEQADAAVAATGIDLSRYDRRVYLMPVQLKCDGRPSGGGFPAIQRVFHFSTRVPPVQALAHELGHTLWLNHASTAADEYGDASDVMGRWRRPVQLNGPHRAQLGWLASENVISVSQPGLYRIGTLEMKQSLPQVLVINRRDAPSQALYLSFRQPIGFDAALPEKFVGRTSVHQFTSTCVKGRNPATILLDTLGDGEDFADDKAGIAVTQVGHDETSATLRIAFTHP